MFIMALQEFDRSDYQLHPLEYLRDQPPLAQKFGFFMVGPPEGDIVNYALLDTAPTSHLPAQQDSTSHVYARQNLTSYLYAQQDLEQGALSILELTVPGWLQKGRLGSLLGYTMLTEAMARGATTLTALECTVHHGLLARNLLGGYDNYEIKDSPGRPELSDIKADLTNAGLLKKLHSFIPPSTHPATDEWRIGPNPL